MAEVSSMKQAVDVLLQKGLSKRQILTNVDSSHFPFEDEEIVMTFIDLQIECSSDEEFNKLVAYLYGFSSNLS
ncbi:hypothetical protein J0K78_12250 [Halobacillus sp. GSS1]|uniref:hypothetical protein n=1 Tax=Halobacillus sp. GSS1 TaxID=2815919 RepID=UPI001A8D229A|nr:hypothetical protein [Halobacillus sp. GSS1]MBN9655042.1 hypothetical protein [Halobacillus sp. GSS1]